MAKNIYKNLGQLGSKTNYPTKPSEAKLEKVENPHPDVDYVVRFTCPEFTSLCPVTGQPDFAHIVIDYVPNKFLVESKAIKLLMFSYRNHAGFHEECTIDIAKKIINFVKPKYLRIGGYWYPRGGIPIDIFFQSGKLPNNVWFPETGVAPYKGRG